jgi:hypothetical protein
MCLKSKVSLVSGAKKPGSGWLKTGGRQRNNQQTSSPHRGMVVLEA